MDSQSSSEEESMTFIEQIKQKVSRNTIQKQRQSMCLQQLEEKMFLQNQIRIKIAFDLKKRYSNLETLDEEIEERKKNRDLANKLYEQERERVLNLKANNQNKENLKTEDQEKIEEHRQNSQKLQIEIN